MYLAQKPNYWMPNPDQRTPQMPMLHYWSAVEVPPQQQQIASMEDYLNLLALRLQWLLEEEGDDAARILSEELPPTMLEWLTERNPDLTQPLPVASTLLQHPELPTTLNLYWNVTFPQTPLSSPQEMSEAQSLIEGMSLAEWLGALAQLETPMEI